VHLQVTEEIENMRFNTGIAAMMEFVNAANKVRARPPKSIRSNQSESISF
jgi:leucyl-tRNA synthetase